MRLAPRRRAGASGAERRTPPSPYQASPRRTAGKTSGSAAEAITCSTVMRVWRLRRCGWSHGTMGLPWIQVTVWPVA